MSVYIVQATAFLRVRCSGYNRRVTPAAATAQVSAHDGYLLACIGGTVAFLLILVGRLRLHAALGLSIAAIALGIVAGIPLERVPAAFTAGAGEMMGHIAIILGMGAIIGQLLSSSGAATALGSVLIRRCGNAGMPWALLALGILVGMPVFFEVGLVLLMPVIADAARRTGRSPVITGLPVLAGLSITHGLLPPHPAALLASTAYHADLAHVILFGLIAGIPAAALAGPILQRVLIAREDRKNRFGDRNSSSKEKKGQNEDKKNPIDRAGEDGPSSVPDAKDDTVLEAASQSNAGDAGKVPERQVDAAPLPAGAGRAIFVILLPVALILAGGWADSFAGRGSFTGSFTTLGSLTNRLLHLTGSPDVAMVIAALAALAVLGRCVQEAPYRVRGGLRQLAADSFIPIAGPLVILSAAGGLSGVLRASGAAQAAVNVALGAHMPPLLLAWVLAATVRVSMGSATVAMAVTSGILAPMSGAMGVRPEMLVLATGAGSLMLSHVNDSGFWLVASLFKMDVKTTLSTWSLVETVLSVSGLLFTLALAAILH
jgi:gluconate:H+ symporter, GntP family